MLSIVATLNEFCSIILGANVHVWTDHKNLTFDSIKTQKVLRWRNQVGEYSPILHYIEGPKNILVDNLSRLHHLITPAQIAEGKNLIEPAEVTDDEEDKFFIDLIKAGVWDKDASDSLECYLNLLDSENPEQNPLSCAYICEQQQAVTKLLVYNKNIQITTSIHV